MNVCSYEEEEKKVVSSLQVRRDEEKVYHNYTDVNSYLRIFYFLLKCFDISVNF